MAGKCLVFCRQGDIWQETLRQSVGKDWKLDHERVISCCYISDVSMEMIRYQVSDIGSFNNAFPPPFKTNTEGLQRVCPIWQLTKINPEFTLKVLMFIYDKH